jgi:tetratricopeptide (TPR) repeat protein/class 3 adenylate cyclase
LPLVKNLIPHFIQQKWLANERHGNFDACTMFVDMSGFTRLTETLMQQGRTGAERLSVILNAIFGPMVGLVYEHGGFIPYFAGDAFIAIFSFEKCERGAEEVLALAQRQFDLLDEASKGFRGFEISIKIGLSCGRVEWGIVGGEHKSFYFRGPAIRGCSDSQGLARQQEIIADAAFTHRLSVPVKLQPLTTKGFFQIAPASALPPAKGQTPPSLPPLQRDVAAGFLPEAVLQFNQGGEFRTVVSVFMAFEGVETHELLDQFACIVLDHIDNFCGYFKEIDFSDKGGVLVAFFGAPVSFENNVERALEFVATVQEDLLPLQFSSGLRFKAGIGTGIAYTGIVGGKERCQYAAVGNKVNIAARAMMRAGWDEVLVDAEVQNNRHFRFQYKGDMAYKGLKEKIPTYLLAGRNIERRQNFEGSMVGRQEELARLTDFGVQAFQHSTADVAYVYGEAGIGKTRLSFELRHQLRRQQHFSWLTCQSDQILRKPFNPFIHFLKSYFEQSSDHTPKKNLAFFEKQFEALLNEIINLEHPDTGRIKREIIRTKPVLAVLVSLKTKNSFWENLDAKGRYQNILAALTSFFQAEALLQPLVIELEDGHWFDVNSVDFLNEFAGRIKNYPVFLLVTSRYDDVGRKPRLFDEAVLQKHGLPRMEVDLNILSREALQELATERLGGLVQPSLLDLLQRTTNGNPFYAEQMLKYFMETGLLKSGKKGWHVVDKNAGFSDSIQAVLTARIDRLSSLVKETIKAAAVIGREFELPVLTEVMKGNEELIRENGNAQTLLKEQVKTAERAQIWQAMNELRYIFRHALLREAVYDMQLGTRLKELHRLIAEAVENLYAENLEQRYVDLVFHYELAGVESKLRFYLLKAAGYARAYFQNHQALHFYNKLLDLTAHEETPEERAKILLKKGSILELIGQWDECEAIYREALSVAKETAKSELLGRVNNLLGHLLMLKGNYEEADGFLETAAAFFGSIHNNHGTSKVYGNLGTLYFRQGKYEDAKLYFIRSIQLAQLYKHSPSNSQIVATLGLTYMNLGKYEDGIRWQQSQLDLCKQVNDRQGMATLYVNMGIVYFEKGDYDDALACYQKGLNFSEELGNKQLTSIAIGCIGNVFQRKGKFDLAMQHFERDLSLVEELGDPQGISIALGLIGELYSVMGEFDKAVEYMQRNLTIGEELGYQKGVAKALNTLGDIYFYKKEYETSLDYYDRSIAVTKSIGNKLVLGFSLVEKGKALLATGNLTETSNHLRECLGIANDIQHPDLLMEVKLLSANLAIEKGEKAEAEAILTELLAQNPARSDLAAIHYKWRKIETGTTHRDEALALYKALYGETPVFVFRQRMEELSGQ